MARKPWRLKLSEEHIELGSLRRRLGEIRRPRGDRALTPNTRLAGVSGSQGRLSLVEESVRLGYEPRI